MSAGHVTADGSGPTMKIETSDVVMEVEATEFAMHLLCPDEQLRAYLDAHPAVAAGDDAALAAMAKAFQVPLVLLGCRIGDIRRRRA